MSTEKVAEFIVGTSYEDIPEEVIVAAKKHILDCLGVMLVGSREPTGKIMIEYVKEFGGKPEAGVVTGGFKTCAPQAALANGTMAHALDYDDYWTSGNGHPTAVILPAILALAERGKLSGKEIMAAYTVGCEVGAKFGSLGTPLLERGWHPTCVLGTLAATAAAARILKLNVEEARVALGIAASEAGGLRQNFGTDTKPFHAGKAARDGIVAALLAKKGFTAHQNILEGSVGFCNTLAGEEYSSEAMADRLGCYYDIVSSGIIKPYPTCAETHRCIGGILHLIKEHQIQAEDVVEVECNTPPFVAQLLVYHHPKTGLEGKFSLEYCMASALLDREVTLRQFTDEKILNPRAQELLRRVKYVHAEGVPTGLEARHRLPHTVTVKLRDGKQYSQEVVYPKGDPSNPMSWEEVSDKFCDCARLALSSKEVGRCIQLVSTLESLRDVSELMVILTTTPAPKAEEGASRAI